MPADQKHTLLVDAGVLMEVLTNAGADAGASAGVLSIVEAGLARAWISVIDLAEVNRELHAGMSSSEARSLMQEIVSLMQVAAADHQTVLSALALGWNSFPQAMNGAIAQAKRVDHLVTRHPKAYRSLQRSVLTPEEYLARHRLGNP